MSNDSFYSDNSVLEMLDMSSHRVANNSKFKAAGAILIILSLAFLITCAVYFGLHFHKQQQQESDLTDVEQEDQKNGFNVVAGIGGFMALLLTLGIGLLLYGAFKDDRITDRIETL
jgi:Na+/H+ antiporter NhaC